MRERTSLLLSAFTVAVTAVVYRPLLSVYFKGDDFLHLFAAVDADLFEYLLRPHGGHLLIIRNAVVVAFYHLFGMRAELYFWAVLLTHLLNTFLLFRVVSNWTGSAALAALGALLWGACPTHGATLGWYSVYGQVLVGTILLIILHQISRADRARTSLPAAIIIGWPLLFIAASTCFGVGIGLTLVSPVALFCLLPSSRQRLWVCLILAAVALITPTAYRALIVYHDRLAGTTQGVWAMAMAMGALDYRAPIFTMFAYLFSAGIADLLLGFASSAAGFPSVASTAATVVYAATVVTAAVMAPWRVRARLFAVLLLAAGCYGIIAAGRATLFTSMKITTSAAIPRYHYVGMMPLSILLTCAIAQLTESSRYAAAMQYGLLLATIALATLLFLRAEPFIDPHLSARKETTNVVTQIRAAIAQAPAGSEVHIPNRRFQSISVLLPGIPSGFPGWAGIFTLFFPDNVVDGKRVRFVVNDPIVAKNIATGKRSRDLFIVGPTPAPAGAKRPATS